MFFSLSLVGSALSLLDSGALDESRLGRCFVKWRSGIFSLFWLSLRSLFFLVIELSMPWAFEKYTLMWA